jgi:hypothetical protein
MSLDMHLSLPSDRSLFVPALARGRKVLAAPDGSGQLVKNVMDGPLARYFLQGIAGGAGGYNESADVVTVLADGTDTRELWAAYQETVRLRNAERQPLIDFLSYFVTQDVEKVYTASSTARFERASEFGVPRSHRPAAAPSYMGFDFDWFDIGFRFTWQFLVDATADQVDAINNQALEADNILMFQMIMWTLFSNTNRTASIREKAYNVYSFYNGTDGETPPPYKTTTFASNHTHYLASGAGTVDGGDLDAMFVALAEHGYKRSLGYNLVLIVNAAQGDVIRTFRTAANGGTGGTLAKWDFIPAQGTPAFLIPRDYIQPAGVNQPPATIQGMDVIGTWGEFTIVQEDYMPAGYMVAFATGGRDTVQNPIGIRQHANPGLRGLRLVKGRQDDYPLQEAYYARGFGTGIRHRGAGVVMQITAGSYAPPTEFAVSP